MIEHEHHIPTVRSDARHAAPIIPFTNLFGMVTYGAPAFGRRVRAEAP